MLLTQTQINEQAQRANWYIQVDLHDVNVPGDPAVITGDGVDDLDRLLAYVPIYPRAKLQIDVGFLNEQYTRCDIEDIRAIKAAYIAYYGNVNKPGFPEQFPRADQLPLAAPVISPPTGVLDA